MLTTRTLSLLLSRHLGVEVAPYAARLVREGLLPRRDRPVEYRAWYEHPESHQATELKRFAEVPGEVIAALADALDSERPNAPLHPASLELH